MAEGLSHQLLFSFSSGWIKTLCCCRWCHGPETTQSCFPGKPHMRKSRQFFFSFLDCYSRAAWKRLWAFWLGSHTLPVEMANANPLNSKTTKLSLFISPVFFPWLCFRINRWFFAEWNKKELLSPSSDETELWMCQKITYSFNIQV